MKDAQKIEALLEKLSLAVALVPCRPCEDPIVLGILSKCASVKKWDPGHDGSDRHWDHGKMIMGPLTGTTHEGSMLSGRYQYDQAVDVLGKGETWIYAYLCGKDFIGVIALDKDQDEPIIALKLWSTTSARRMLFCYWCAGVDILAGMVIDDWESNPGCPVFVGAAGVGLRLESLFGFPFDAE